MKIIEFTESSFISYSKPSDQFSVLPTAAQQSCRILMAALEAVNQAGLDGKRLSKLELRSRAVYEGGYDIIHEHPNCDGAALGAASYQDFLIFARSVENLEGGVMLSFGSVGVPSSLTWAVTSLVCASARMSKTGSILSPPAKVMAPRVRAKVLPKTA